MSKLPRITLITPSYQQAGYLEECLRSVHEQGYPDLEHIVVDGGSTDGSAEIIKAWAPKLHWWCSERDKGQSDALNKGLQHATGDVFSWLNSDDMLEPGSLERVGRAFMEDPQLVIFEGLRIIIDPDGTRSPARQNDPHDRDRLFLRPSINQQSTYFSMEAIRAVGGVDTALHHIMDMELWWRVLFRYGTDRIKIDPTPIAAFRLHEESKTGKGLGPFIAEQASVLHGACRINGDAVLAELLAIGHPIRDGLRRMDMAAGHAEMVRRMTLSFLWKWHRVIHEEHQFRMMKAFRQRVPESEILQVWDHGSLAQLDQQLGQGGWTVFRARRKWKHLFG